MVARAHRDPFGVEEGSDVVGMEPRHAEGHHGAARLGSGRPVDGDARNRGQRLHTLDRQLAAVLLHPLHAVTDTNGHYRIDGVPVGTKLTVFTRLAAIGETAKNEVEVLAGVVQTVDLTLKYTATRDAGAPPQRKDAEPPLK